MYRVRGKRFFSTKYLAALLVTVLVTVLTALGGAVLAMLLAGGHGVGSTHLLGVARVHLAHVVAGLGGHCVGAAHLLLGVARVHLTVHAHGREGGLSLARGLVAHVSDATGRLALVSGLGRGLGGLGLLVGVGVHVDYLATGCGLLLVGLVGWFRKARMM